MPIQESGYTGPLFSLSGVLGVPGRGRVVTYGSQAITGVVVPTQILGDNPRRIAANIVLWTATTSTPVILYLGEPPAANAAGLPLSALGDSLQLDKDLPWSGPIYVASLGGGPYTIGILEVSVQ